MKTYKVAFIDDGINPIFFPNIKINAFKLREGEILLDNHKDINDSLTHGTVCLGVFLANVAIEEFEIYSLKILNASRHASSEALKIALKWTLYQKIDLISLSIGSSYFLDRQQLEGIVNELYYKKAIVVAAQNNNYCITYPASFSNVIGVMASKGGSTISFHSNYLKDGIDICAQSEHPLVFNNKSMLTQFSNSFAAPCVTASVLNLMNELKGYNRDALIRNLCSLNGKNVPAMFGFDWCCHAYFVVTYDLIMKQYIPFEVFDVAQYTGIECENDIKKDIIENSGSLDTLIIIDYKNQIGNEFLSQLITLPVQNLVFFSPLKLSLEKFNKEKYLIKNHEFAETFHLECFNSADVPIICIYADNEKLELLISCLIETKKEFFSNGYHCKCLTNYEVAILYDIETLDEFENKYFEQYTEFYNIDLFVIGIVSIENWRAALKPDLEFNLNELDKRETCSLYSDILFIFENNIMED